MRYLAAKKLAPHMALGLAVLVQTLFTANWLTEYPLIFGPYYLQLDYDLATVLKLEGFGPWLSRLMEMEYYPPGYFAVGSLFVHFFGYSLFSFALVNLCFVAMAVWATYGIGRIVHGRFLGMTAALLLLFMPAVSVCMRIPMPEIALIGPVALANYSLLALDRFKRSGFVVLFVAAFALAMYIKWTAFIFVIGPAFIVIARAMVLGIREQHPNSFLGMDFRQWLNLIGCGVFSFALLAPWYLGSLDWAEIRRTSVLDGVYVDNVWQMLGYYAEVLRGVFQAKFVIFVIVFCSALLLAHPKKERFLPVLFWLAVSFFVFSLAIQAKEPRYLFPALPAVALILAGGIEAVRKVPIPWKLGLVVMAIIFSHNLWFSFKAPLCPMPTGYLEQFERPSCPKSSQAAHRSLEKILHCAVAPVENENAINVIVWTEGEFRFLFDANTVNYWMWLRNEVGQVRPQFVFQGFDQFPNSEHALDSELPDFLLVSLESESGLQEMGWIYDRFVIAGRIESECFTPIFVLARRDWGGGQTTFPTDYGNCELPEFVWVPTGPWDKEIDPSLLHQRLVER
jgi:hypothetical protein